MTSTLKAFLTLWLLGTLTSLISSPGFAQDPAKVVAKVNGKEITEGDLQFMLISRSVPKDAWAEIREQVLELCIDRELMKQFLAERKAVADPEQIQAAVDQVYSVIRRSNSDPQQVLNSLGYTEAKLKQEVALPLNWTIQLDRMVTPQVLRDYFDKHREEFDGTEVRASQIFLKARTPEEVQQAKTQLSRIRADIASGKLSFSEAAKQFSQSPTREQGGDLGFFPYRGKMPVSISRPAFALQAGEMSEPFETSFGVHLLLVNERKPGDLSLEDVRSVVYSSLSRETWEMIIQEQREQGMIEILQPE